MPEESVSILAIVRDQFSTAFGKINRNFSAIRAEIDKVNKALGPVTGRVTAFVASFAGLAAARKAFQLAEQQVQAEARLLAALRGRTQALNAILEVTQEIANATLVQDEALVEQATLLANAGIEAAKIPDALRAAVDTASALGVPVEQVTTAIIQFQENQSGLLARRLPLLKQLQEDGRLADEGVRTLLERFSGAAAAEAETSFGKVEQASNRFGEALEDLGKIILELINQPLARLVARAEEIAKVLGEGTSKKIAAGFGAIAAELTPIVDALVLIVGAGIAGRFLKFVTTGLVAFRGLAKVVVSIAGRFGALVALLGVLGFKVAGLAGEFTRASSDVEELGSKTDETADKVLRLTQFLQRFLRVFSFLLQQIVAVPLKALDKGLDTVSRSVGIAAGEIAVVLADAFGGPQAQATANRFLEISKEEFKKSSGELVGVFENTFEQLIQIEADFRAEENKKRADTVKAEQDAQAQIVKATKERFDEVLELVSGSAKLGAAANLLKPEDLIGISTEGIDRALSSVPKLLRDEASSLITAELERQVQAEEITIAKFFELRRRVELGFLEQDLAQRRQQISDIEDEARDLFDQAALASGRQERFELITAAVEKASQLEGLQEELIDLQTQLGEKTIGIEQDVLSSAENIKQSAEGVVQASTEFADTVFEDLRSGVIGIDDANQLLAQSLFVTDQKIREMTEQVQALVEVAGDGTEQQVAKIAEDVLKQFDLLVAGIGQKRAALQAEVDKQSVGGFFDAIGEGATKTIQQFGDLQAAGQELGASLVTNLTDGLITLFTEGTKSFRAFLGQFLQGIALMLARLVLLRALASALGIPIIPAATGNTGGEVVGGGIKLAGGGPVPGPNVHQDVTPALLTPGEWVIKEDSSDYLGREIMAGINAKIFPRSLFMPFLRGRSVAASIGRTRFQTGGPVAGGSIGNAQLQAAFIAATESEAKRMVGAKSDKVVLDALARNPAFVRSIARGSTR